MTTTHSPVRPLPRGTLSAEAIVARYRQLALRLARRFDRPRCSLERLELTACSALEEAARRHDVRRADFGAFAVARILAELRRRRPAALSRALAEPLVRSAEDAFVASRGRRPTAAEASRILGWAVEDVVDARLVASRARGASRHTD